MTDPQALSNPSSGAVGPDGVRHDLVPYLNLMVTMVMFGGAFASSKVVVDAMPHEIAAAFRFGGGALVLLAVVLAGRRRRTGFRGVDAFRAAAVGVIGVFAYNLFFFWGLSLAPAVDGSIIVPVLSPILTVIAMCALGKGRPNRLQLSGLVVGGFGAMIFLLAVGGAGDRHRLMGDAIFLVAAACWAGYSIISKSVLSGVDPLHATTWGVCTGAVLLILYALPHIGATPWSAVGITAWLNIVFLAVGPTAVAYLFYYRGLREVSPIVATLLMFTVPVIGSACSFLFLGERLNAGQLIGAIVLLAGAIFAVVAPQITRRRHKDDQFTERAQE